MHKPSATKPPPPPLEIETVAQFVQHTKAGLPLSNVVFQGLDLTEHSEAICHSDLRGSVFLGCELTSHSLKAAQNHGALIFPPFHGLLYKPYRGCLYTAEELYTGFDHRRPETYHETLDARIFDHWASRGGEHAKSIIDTLAQRLHDHAITDALEDLLERGKSARKIVAIMGGHSMARGAADYRQVHLCPSDASSRLYWTLCFTAAAITLLAYSVLRFPHFLPLLTVGTGRDHKQGADAEGLLYGVRRRPWCHGSDARRRVVCNTLSRGPRCWSCNSSSGSQYLNGAIVWPTDCG